MHRTVLVDGNTTRLEKAANQFRSAGHDVATAGTGRDGIAMAAEYLPHSLIVNLILPDVSGIDVVRAVRRARPTSCIVVTGVAKCHQAVKSMRSGADYCIEGATDSRILIRMVKAMRWEAPVASTGDDPVVGHSLQRWADLVVRSIDSRADLRTLHDWSRFVGVSVGGLRNWCRTASLPPRRSLLFIRLLRAVIKQQQTGLPADDLLNIVDRRTLEKLLVLGGGSGRHLPASPDDFFERQQLIHQPRAIATVRVTLNRQTVC